MEFMMEKERGLLHLYCGDGKGKTTTAILLAGIMILLSAGCSNTSMRSDTVTTERSEQQNTQTESSREPDAASVTEGTEEDN